jgi:hypothetical protein
MIIVSLPRLGVLTEDDHLDYQTILDIWKYHQRTVHFMVPLGAFPHIATPRYPTPLTYSAQTMV